MKGKKYRIIELKNKLKIILPVFKNKKFWYVTKKL